MRGFGVYEKSGFRGGVLLFLEFGGTSLETSDSLLPFEIVFVDIVDRLLKVIVTLQASTSRRLTELTLNDRRQWGVWYLRSSYHDYKKY
jgi:hypothetical protein